MAGAEGDRELVTRCLGGDPRAWEELVRRHAESLYRIVRRVLSRPGEGASAADVEDVLQAVFLKLWEDDCRRLRSWEGRSRLATWLVAVARREAISHKRRAGRGETACGALAGTNGALPAALARDLAASPLGALELAELNGKVHEAVARLPLRERLLVRLVYFDEASYQDAARALDVPLNSISPWLARARRRLAGYLVRWKPQARSPDA